MQTIEDFYQYLLSHDLVEKVIQYNEMYTYIPDHRITCNPLSDLFEWNATPEGTTYWYTLYNSYSMSLEPTSIEHVLEYLRTRVNQQETPYEYW